MTGLRRAVAFLVAFGAVAFGIAASAMAKCEIEVMADLPVTLYAQRVVVPAKINGRDVNFAVDSGAFFSLISAPKAAELKLETIPAPDGYSISGIGGDQRVRLARPESFSLTKEVLHKILFIVGGADVGADTVGVIGQNVLGLADVDYDLANGAIKLIHPEHCDATDVLAYWSTDGAYSEIPIQPMDYSERETVGEVTVNGHRMRAAFDTGAPVSELSLRAASWIGLMPGGPGVEFAGYHGGIGRGVVKSWIAPVDSFQVGQEAIKNTHMRIGDFDMDNIDMLIGLDFLLSHHVYVANGQHKIYLTYNGGPVFDLRRDAGAVRAPTSTPSVIAAGSTLGAGTPADAETLSRLGAALAERREPTAAIADYDRAIQVAPKEPRYLYQRAMARLQINEPAPARLDLDKALQLKPDYVDARMLRAALLIEADDRPAARADADIVAASLPTSSEARMELADDYISLDQFGPAITQIDRWLATHPDDSHGTALNERCWARALWGQELDQALADCNRALHEAPAEGAFLDSRGLVHLRLGQFPQAIADYDAALKLNPKMGWSLYGRGFAELKTGDPTSITVAQSLDL